MPYFNIVAQTNEDTVVAEYEPVKQKANSYQSYKRFQRERPGNGSIPKNEMK